MPTVTITAFDAKKLPSPLQLTSWREDWEKAGGQWAGPQIDDKRATATFTVTGRTVTQVENTVDPTIDKYNETHTGNDAISVSVT